MKVSVEALWDFQVHRGHQCGHVPTSSAKSFVYKFCLTSLEKDVVFAENTGTDDKTFS